MLYFSHANAIPQGLNGRLKMSYEVNGKIIATSSAPINTGRVGLNGKWLVRANHDTKWGICEDSHFFHTKKDAQAMIDFAKAKK